MKVNCSSCLVHFQHCYISQIHSNKHSFFKITPIDHFTKHHQQLMFFIISGLTTREMSAISTSSKLHLPNSFTSVADSAIAPMNNEWPMGSCNIGCSCDHEFTTKTTGARGTLWRHLFSRKKKLLVLLNHEKTCHWPARYCSNYGELLLLLSHFSSISLNNRYKKWVSERKLSKSQPE